MERFDGDSEQRLVARTASFRRDTRRARRHELVRNFNDANGLTRAFEIAPQDRAELADGRRRVTYGCAYREDRGSDFHTGRLAPRRCWAICWTAHRSPIATIRATLLR